MLPQRQLLLRAGAALLRPQQGFPGTSSALIHRNLTNVRAISSTTVLQAAASTKNDRKPSRAAVLRTRHNGNGNGTPARKVAPLLKSASKKSISREKSQVLMQLQTLVAKTHHLTKTNHPGGQETKEKFVPDLAFLREASRLLQLCRTKDQCVAALPLCAIVEQSSDVVHGSAAMECVRIYHRVGKNEQVVALVDKLLANNFFLMNPVLTHAIQACSSLGNTTKGMELFEAAVQRGTIPNLTVYASLLGLCGTAGDFEKVAMVREKMAQSGVEMNHIAYHNLMSAYAKGGHVEQALSLFDELEKQGLQADEHTYAILMDAYAEKGDYEQTLTVMDELKKRAPALTPNLVHYNVLLKACGKASDLPSAFQFYEEMKERKITPDLITYITMMHAVFHGELGVIDAKKVKAALISVGCMGAACMPFIDFQEYLMTTLFCGTLVGSMGLAAYMNPDGVRRALYPNSDEPKTASVIEAFFLRLREEDHCGRSIYLWREMLKFGIPPDPRVFDVLVRTCVRKRHPELAFEVGFQENLPLVDNDGAFIMPLATTIQLLHSLLVQRRTQMADTVFDAGYKHKVFAEVFQETGKRFTYDLRTFASAQVRSYTISKILNHLHEDAKNGALPSVDFLVQHGYEVLDQLDTDDANARTLFSMDDMKREASGPNAPGQYFFRLSVSSASLQEFFANTASSTGNEQRL